jgi:outer membrane protein assembly factor BamB
MEKRGVLSVILVLISITLLLLGCAGKTEKLPPPTEANNTREAVPEQNTTEEPIPEANNTEETAPPTMPKAEDKPPALEEKPMKRGIADPDFVVDIYDREKAMDGTTLFADNHNTEKPRIIEVNMLGEIIWEYDLPQELKRYTNPGFDVERLPNDNILFVLPGNGVYEVSRDKKAVWSYKTEKISHDADRLPNGNTIFVFGGNDLMADAQVKEVNPKGQTVWSWYAKDDFNKAPYKTIMNQGWTHTNAVTRLSNGNTLISTRNFNMVVEVDQKGEVVKTIGEGLMAQQHDPAFLENGDILFANHGKPEKAVEIDKDGKVVWEFAVTNPQQWPVRDANRLPNGNTLIVTTTKIVEVSKDKKVVWSFAIKDTSKFVRQAGAGLGFYKAERIVE